MRERRTGGYGSYPAQSCGTMRVGTTMRSGAAEEPHARPRWRLQARATSVAALAAPHAMAPQCVAAPWRRQEGQICDKFRRGFIFAISSLGPNYIKSVQCCTCSVVHA